MDLKNILLITGFICMCFFGIPLRIKKKSTEKLLFESYIAKFNKTYRNETEYQLRFEHFQASLQFIDELNKNRTSQESAMYGLTMFSDLSKDEFKHRHLQHNQVGHGHTYHEGKRKPQMPGNNIRKKRAVGTLPVKLDWRTSGVVSGVRNQRTCGACWAFSTVETVESMFAIRTGQLQSLSVQEMIDCAQNGNFGCEGGDMCSLLEWLVTTKTKIQPEKSYPFAYATQTCSLKPATTGIQVAPNYTCDNFIGKENNLLDKLVNHGPVAVAVNAVNWQYYLGGVIQFHCSGDSLNHAVQIVGYDQTSQVPHYIVRNSWGVDFGDNGYLYIAIGANVCGLANEVTALDVLI